MAQKRKLEQSGITDEQKPVICNVGYTCFSLGVPLEIVLSFFKERDFVVDWTDYIDEAIKDGHNPRTVLSKIEAAVGDVYGPRYAEQVMIRAEHYYGIRTKRIDQREKRVSIL